MFSAAELKRQLAAFAMPNECPFCGRIISIDRYWCEECYEELPFLQRSVNAPQHLERLYSVCSYERAARSAVLRMKEGCFACAAEAMAVLMIECIGEDFRGIDLLAYVPSSRHSVRYRGYSPAGLIAKNISARVHIPCARVLRCKDSKLQQKRLSRKERPENAAQGFETINAKYIVGNNILLVDDVATTGSTLSACAEKLLKCGAASVKGAVFAKTVLKQV